MSDNPMSVGGSGEALPLSRNLVTTIKHSFTLNPGLHMRRLYRKRLITPTPASLKKAPTEMLIMMASNESGLLSAGGLANIAAEIKLRNNSKN